MKKLTLYLLMLLSVVFQSSLAMAEESVTVADEPLFAFYGISEEANDGDHESGLGFDYDSEIFNLTIEGTSERWGLTSSTKFNLFDDDIYMKLGGAYASEKFYAESESLWADQYALGAALGFKPIENVYLEAGSIYTDLEKANFSNGYVFLGEETVSTYIEGVKRLDFGWSIIDLSGNYAYVNYENASDTDSYGLGLDIYPTSYTKLSAYYQDNKYSDTKVFSAQYKYLRVEYQPENEYVSLGVQFNFGADGISKPTNLIKDISDNHRFEADVKTNIEVKPRGIVKVVEEDTDESTDDEADTEDEATEEETENTAPTGAPVTVDASTDASITVELGSQIDDPDGDDMTIIIVGYSSQTPGLTISEPTVSGTSVTVTATAGVGTATVDYKVSDGTDESEVYTITVTSLDGE